MGVIRRTKDLGSTSITMPTGVVSPFAGSTAPTGWLLCFGQEAPISLYGALYGVLGTTYGSLTNGSGGAGSTHFRLPDLRGRVIAGVDNMGGSTAGRLSGTTITGGADALGRVGGAQTHQLSIDEMPSHNHSWSTVLMDNPSGSGYPLKSGLLNNSNFSNPTGSTGGGQAHNNVQPTMVLNYIIKA